MAREYQSGTCLVAAVQKNGDITFGADTQCTAGGRIYYAEKIWTASNHIFSGTGRVRHSQAVQFGATIPEPPPTFNAGELHRHMVVNVVPAIKAALKKQGLLGTEDDDDDSEGRMELALLVGVNGSLFSVGSDFSVVYFPDGYAADGCGGDAARSVLTDRKRAKKYLTQADLTAALEAAAHHESGCNEVVTFETLKAPEVQVFKFAG